MKANLKAWDADGKSGKACRLLPAVSLPGYLDHGPALRQGTLESLRARCTHPQPHTVMVCPIERNTFVAGCVSSERRGRYLCLIRGFIPAQTPLYCLLAGTSAQLTPQYCQVQDPC